MLTHTFCHIPHIGAKREAHLWSTGVHTWAGLADAAASGMFPTAGPEVMAAAAESEKHLAECNPLFFANLLPAHEHWRLFPEFRDRVAYFDIETTGVAPPHDTITTIALYDGRQIRYYVRGRNLDEFPRDVAEYRLLVTFNGSMFDIPYVERFFGIKLGLAQIDLRFVLNALGYTGGLKKCERTLGIDRGDLDGVNGFLAVVLWREFSRKRDVRALETLLAYNIADTVNLERLMVVAYNEHVSRTPFGAARMLPMPDSPPLPFTADATILQKMKVKYARFLRD